MNRWWAKVFGVSFWVFSLAGLAVFLLEVFGLIPYGYGKEVFITSVLLAVGSVFGWMQASGIVLRC